MSRRRVAAPGFSLIELVIVVVIIGILAAIAVPRLARGSANAADSALAKDLSVLRAAVELYRAEHGSYPTCDPLGGNKTTIMLQLTQYTDAAGNTSATRSAVHSYGPYVREIPPVTVGTSKGRTKVNTADGSAVGWIYDPATGAIRANTASEVDSRGRLYSEY